MNLAFCDYIPLLETKISSQLISPNGIQKIHAAAQQLPNALTSWLAFECQLDGPNTQADFAVCVQAQSEGQQVLCGDRFSVQLPETILQSPTWQSIRGFSKAWVSEISPLHSQVQNIWLKFNTSSSSDAVLHPICFFISQPIFNSTQGNSAHQFIIPQTLNLLGCEVSESLQQQLFHCIDWLPENAYVSQIGVIPSQPAKGIQLCLQNLTPDQILDYLEHIDWRGSLTDLRSHLPAISGLVDRISLSLDLGEKVLPRLELEGYLDRQPLAEPRWPLLLDYLITHHLCLPTKRDSLLAFPGMIRQSHYPDHWSTHLTALTQLLGEKYEVIFLQGLHSVKLVCEAEGAIAAKAHLTVVKTVLDKAFIKQVVPLALGIV